MSVPVVLGSANARVGLPAAIEVLRAGRSAMDAAIEAVRRVEDNRDDHGVGTGGLPNVLGQVELDACVMDGRTLAAGAVAAIKGYPHPIEIARKVMEITPHVLLAGAGAELFAERHGFERAELLTPEAEAIWRERILGGAPTGSNLYADSYQYMAVVRDWTALLHDRILGTTNVIVRDEAGDIASAVSTSGWGFKWPGRVGDSPIIGAGNYADNRYGAAACTGRGEMAIRAATAYSIVRSMRDGLTLADALRRAMLDLHDLVDPFAERLNVMNAVAIDRDGNVAAISTAKDTYFVFQTLEMSEPEERLRDCVPLRPLDNAPDDNVSATGASR